MNLYIHVLLRNSNNEPLLLFVYLRNTENEPLHSCSYNILTRELIYSYSYVILTKNHCHQNFSAKWRLQFIRKRSWWKEKYVADTSWLLASIVSYRQRCSLTRKESSCYASSQKLRMTSSKSNWVEVITVNT